MCDPISLISMAVSAGGSLMAGAAQSSANKAQAAQYEAQAQLQRRQADIEQVTGQYEARKKQDQIDRVTATQRNRVAGSGVSIEGSPTDIMLDTAREGALDVAAIQWGQGLKATNLGYSADISQMNAGISRQAAKTAMTTGFVNAASSGFDAYNKTKTTRFGTGFGST